MEIKKIEGIIEALLFAAGEAVPLEKISRVVEQDQETTRKIIHAMEERYHEDNRGIQIIHLEGSYQLCTKEQYYQYIQSYYVAPKKLTISDTLLETLSIIAYEQPITKAQIEHIRGVRCDHVVNKLIEYNLVCEQGRMNAPGRPILFGTTEDFLRFFGLSSIKGLPTLKQEILEKMNEEIQLELEAKR